MATYRIEVSATAERQIRKLPRTEQMRVVRVIQALSTWAHPAILDFDDPFVLAPNDFIDFQCEWDNGISRPVRRCGDSAADVGCTPGEPRAVTFGLTAQDEMCFLAGLYYTD
jgi:hypothetical protein